MLVFEFLEGIKTPCVEVVETQEIYLIGFIFSHLPTDRLSIDIFYIFYIFFSSNNLSIITKTNNLNNNNGRATETAAYP